MKWTISDNQGWLGTVEAKTSEKAIKKYLERPADRLPQIIFNLKATKYSERRDTSMFSW